MKWGHFFFWKYVGRQWWRKEKERHRPAMEPYFPSERWVRKYSLRPRVLSKVKWKRVARDRVACFPFFQYAKLVLTSRLLHKWLFLYLKYATGMTLSCHPDFHFSITSSERSSLPNSIHSNHLLSLGCHVISCLLTWLLSVMSRLNWWLYTLAISLLPWEKFLCSQTLVQSKIQQIFVEWVSE